MADFCTCSACGADLRGGPIPTEYLHMYGGEAVCPYGCGSPRHYSRLIGIYDIERDRTASWLCPDCGKETPRG